MEHALQLQLPNLRRSLAIPIAAAVLGAGAATGTYALIDNESVSPGKVVVVAPQATDSNALPARAGGPRP